MSNPTDSLIERALFAWREEWRRGGVEIDENDMNSFVAGFQAAQAYMGDASTRKDEGCTGTTAQRSGQSSLNSPSNATSASVVTTSPAKWPNALTIDYDLSQPSEISVNRDLLLTAIYADIEAETLGNGHPVPTETVENLAQSIMGTITPYLRTTEPVHATELDKSVAHLASLGNSKCDSQWCYMHPQEAAALIDRLNATIAMKPVSSNQNIERLKELLHEAPNKEIWDHVAAILEWKRGDAAGVKYE